MTDDAKDKANDYPPTDTLTLWATLERLAETKGECGAAILLRGGQDNKWYEWDTCNKEAGHEGPHQVWSDRDSDEWATWTDTTKAVSRQVSLDQPQKLKASPWTKRELEVLKALKGTK